MQLSELLSSSQKNEQFLNQLMNQVFHSGDQTTPLCIRHLIATHRLDVQYLTDMINTFPDSDDTLLDLVADALCNADIMPNRTQAEQKAAELIREAAGKPASCKEAFASLPLNIQHDLISCCCCCCSTYKNIDPNLSFYDMPLLFRTILKGLLRRFLLIHYSRLVLTLVIVKGDVLCDLFFKCLVPVHSLQIPLLQPTIKSWVKESSSPSLWSELIDYLIILPSLIQSAFLKFQLIYLS